MASTAYPQEFKADPVAQPISMLQKLIWLALAGAVGTLTRYGLSTVVGRTTGNLFPWGTVTVNLLGCFLAGLVWSLTESRLPQAAGPRAMILVGFMGAFTTFSALMMETANLFRSEEYARALGNLFLQNGVGIIALGLGLLLGRLFTGWLSA